jgi:hypothetical protein
MSFRHMIAEVFEGGLGPQSPTSYRVPFQLCHGSNFGVALKN